MPDPDRWNLPTPVVDGSGQNCQGSRVQVPASSTASPSLSARASGSSSPAPPRYPESSTPESPGCNPRSGSTAGSCLKTKVKHCSLQSFKSRFPHWSSLEDAQNGNNSELVKFHGTVHCTVSKIIKFICGYWNYRITSISAPGVLIKFSGFSRKIMV